MDKSVAASRAPKLSVLMCVFNGEHFLREAVESVLAQDFSDFEFIIIDDGSTDGTAAILNAFDDPRIRITHNGSNLGLINALNLGLEMARGEFIGRMDADDICQPDRFQKQLALLEDNPEIGCCGSWLRVIGESTLYKFPLTHEAIKAALLEYNPMAHPSIVFRSKLIQEAGLSYDLRFPGAEDYELWSRIIFLTGFANISEPLLLYRRHDQQVTQKKQATVETSSGRIKLGLLRSLAIAPDERESTVHLFLFNGQFRELKKTPILPEADRWLYKLYSANKSLRQFEERYLLELWQSKLLITCISRYDLKVWAALKRSKCFQYAGVPLWERRKIFIKCLLRKKVD